MNKLKQVYLEVKVKLNSISTIMLFLWGLSFIFIMIAFLMRININPFQGIAIGKLNYISIDLYSIIPLCISAAVLSILFNVKNSRKSFDNFGSTSETYFLSNFTSTITISTMLSVCVIMSEILIVTIVGTLPSWPLESNNMLILLKAIGINLCWYLMLSFIITKIITNIICNISNRNYIKLVISIVIPILSMLLLLLITNCAFDGGLIYGEPGLPMDDPYRVWYEMLSSPPAYLIALVIGLIVYDAVNYIMCVKRGRLR